MGFLSFLKQSPKQQYIQGEIENYLSLIEQCSDHFVQCIEDYLTKITITDEFMAWAHKIQEFESQGDDRRRDIERVMYAKGLIPQSRGDVLGLLEAMDRLPNRMASVVQILYTENISLPPRYQEDFQNLALINVEAVRETVLLMRSFIQALEGLSERIQRIGEEESSSDSLERRLIYDLFRTDELTDFQRIILRDLFLEVGAISDFAENFADRVGVCSVKRLF